MSRIHAFTLLAAMTAAPLVAFAQSSDTTATTTTAHPSPFAHMLKKMDSDGDGKISSAEFQTAALARFNAIDTQGSGKITAAQIAATHGAGERGEKFAEHEVAKIGSDGTISKDQYLAAAQARFAKLDKNGDGFITADEVPAGPWGHGRGGKHAAQQQ